MTPSSQATLAKPRSDFSPYIGPRPFDLADRHLYFGRSVEIRELLSLIMGHNIVLLYSPSGAGKTSLINTQILSISGEDSDLDTPEVWPVALVRGAVPKGIEMRRIRNIYVWNALSRWVDSSECNSLLTTTLTEFLNRPLAARRAAQRARVLIFC